jgi:hypothetical protein
LTRCNRCAIRGSLLKALAVLMIAGVDGKTGRTKQHE